MSLALIVALFGASCGSSSPRKQATTAVRGPAFRFSAPASWRVRRAAASVVAESRADPAARVSAVVYRLATTYTPDRFAEAAKELDGVAAKLAHDAGGSVTDAETTAVAGLEIRAYRFTARAPQGRRYDDRVGFVLHGRREVQLLCQAPSGAGDPDGACALLFSSFTLTG